jgi:hypothetical protein
LSPETIKSCKPCAQYNIERKWFRPIEVFSFDE